MKYLFPFAVIWVMGLSFSVSPTFAAPFVPKTGVERKALFLAPVEKQIVVTPDVKEDALEKLARIENVRFLVDGQGQFPPRKLLELVAATGKPMTIVLPPDFALAHLRRLETIEEYDALFRITKDTFTETSANRALSLGPRRKFFELGPSDLTPPLVALMQ